jgi:hypothetical protein
MFEYFLDNYNWSLAVSLAIAMGGEMSEVDSACRPLRCLAGTAVDDATQQTWFDSWTATAVQLEELAARDETAGHLRSAARKRRRSCVYHLMAERMMTNLSPLKLASYRSALTPRGGDDDPGGTYRIHRRLTQAAPRPPSYAGLGGRRLCLIFFNGYDVTKEFST